MTDRKTKRKVGWWTAGPSLGRKKSEKGGQKDRQERKGSTWCDGKVSKSRKRVFELDRRKLTPCARLLQDCVSAHMYLHQDRARSHSGAAGVDPHTGYMQTGARLLSTQQLCNMPVLRKCHTPTPWETPRKRHQAGFSPRTDVIETVRKSFGPVTENCWPLTLLLISSKPSDSFCWVKVSVLPHRRRRLLALAVSLASFLVYFSSSSLSGDFQRPLGDCVTFVSGWVSHAT